MAWYQRNYSKHIFRFIKIFLLLSISFYFLDFFEHNKVFCSPHKLNNKSDLVRLVIDEANNLAVLHSNTLDPSNVKMMFELYRENFMQAQQANILNQKSFSISKFMRPDGAFFRSQSAYNHWNISLELYSNWQWNTGVYHQFTSFHKGLSNSIQLLNNFNPFEGGDLFTNIYENSHTFKKSVNIQLISNEIRFYDHFILKPIERGDKLLKQLQEFKYNNHTYLINHFKKSIKLD